MLEEEEEEEEEEDSFKALGSGVSLYLFNSTSWRRCASVFDTFRSIQMNTRTHTHTHTHTHTARPTYYDWAFPGSARP